MLPNSDINGFQQLAVLMAGGNVPVQDPVTGITYKFDLSTLVSETTTDFRWVSTHSYDTGEIVSYNGSLWESQGDDNEANIPVTGSVFWMEVPGSKSLTWWKAGVYTEDKVAVLSDHRGQPRWYILKAAARPYNSADIAAEELAGDWDSYTESLEDIIVPGSALIEIDFKRHKDARVLVADALNADFELIFSNGVPRRFVIVMVLTLEAIKIKLPDTCLMADAGWNQDDSYTWTAPDGSTTGVWLLKAERTGPDDNPVYLVQMLGRFQ